jgi:hypothetical protein
MSMKKPIKIANAGGYWGDDPEALVRQLKGPRVDYITMDFLAEITMSIMQKQRARDPSLGYARDFLPMLQQAMPLLLENKVKLITNAGGVHPAACARAIMALGKTLGLKPKVAVVFGDDIMADLPSLGQRGAKLDNMETGRAFSEIADRVLSANVYFGATGVVRALEFDPDIVITGRVTDTGITLAPMIHHFGWADFDRLASGIVAGHILECGAQSTGGNFTDWRTVKSFHNIGYPIVEVEEDGAFVVTKHPGSGGAVTVETVREQLFYEMGDPKSYITPDVVADFSTIQLAPAGENRVHVSGVKGYEATPTYKVSMAFADGAKCQGEVAICGPEARAKAECFAEIFWQKVGKDFAATQTEFFGWNSLHRSLGHQDDGNEILLRLGARHADQGPLKRFSKMIPALILSGPPAVCVVGGAPKVQDVVSYWPALLDKSLVKTKVALCDDMGEPRNIKEYGADVGHYKKRDTNLQTANKVVDKWHEPANGTALSTICLGRSGDKGDTANIGVMARSQLAYDWLKDNLTAQVVKNMFHELCAGKVIRCEVPNMQGFNFLLEESLGGGGTLSLRTDAQGKMFAQGLLRQKMAIPEEVVQSCSGSPRNTVSNDNYSRGS